MIWDDAAVARLEELHREGLSSSQIGAQLGCSRNAVIGKIDRSGLRLRAYDEGYRQRPKSIPNGLKARRARSRISAGYCSLPEREPAYIPPEPDKPATMAKCSLLQLTDKTCRFPIGDPKEPGFHFCGNDVAGEGVVYCDHHMRISYITAAQRRAERLIKPGEPYYGPKT